MANSKIPLLKIPELIELKHRIVAVKFSLARLILIHITSIQNQDCAIDSCYYIIIYTRMIKTFIQVDNSCHIQNFDMHLSLSGVHMSKFIEALCCVILYIVCGSVCACNCVQLYYLIKKFFVF